jgi:hypothetical protein
MSVATRSALSGTIRANQALLHRSSMTARESPDQSPHDLESDYLELNRDIAMLQCELKFMREHATELEQTIFYERGALLAYGGDPIGQGNCAMVEIVLQQAELTVKLDQTRLHIGSVAVHSLREEVMNGRQLCTRYEAALNDLINQTRAMVNEIDVYRDSIVFREVQQKKSRFIDLCQCIATEQQKHQELRLIMVELGNSSLPQESINVQEVENTQKIERKLDEVRRKYFERLDTLMNLRQTQVDDIQAARECLENSRAALEEKKAKERAIRELMAEISSKSDDSDDFTDAFDQVL